jgi:hypothetical protein
MTEGQRAMTLKIASGNCETIIIDCYSTIVAKPPVVIIRNAGGLQISEEKPSPLPLTQMPRLGTNRRDGLDRIRILAASNGRDFRCAEQRIARNQGRGDNLS